MKAAYAAWGNPLDLYFASGTPYYIMKMMQESGIETEIAQIEIINKPFYENSYAARLKQAFIEGDVLQKVMLKSKEVYYKNFTSKTYLRGFDPSVIKWRAAQVEKKLNKIDHDFVFAWSNHFTAFLKSEKPLVFWNDYTFAGYMEIYPPFANLCRATIEHGRLMEEQTLSNCNLAIYSSEWAAKTALDNYPVNPEKVKVIPFGPNLECDRNKQDIEKIIENKSSVTCKLLLVGVDWYAKGADKALAVAEELNRRGIKTELDLVGCKAPVLLPDFVKEHGFISKKTMQGRNKLASFYKNAHFLILPSRFECFGIVFAEASSFGLPSLAARVGGIPTAVTEGKNGQLFSSDASPEDYCDYIEEVMASDTYYRKLALSSFEEYEKKLNWTVSGRKFRALIEKSLAVRG